MFWATKQQKQRCKTLDVRCDMAWQLMKHFSLVMSSVTRQDTAGRAILDPMPPKEVVERCFALADAFFDTVETRDGFKVENVPD